MIYFWSLKLSQKPFQTLNKQKHLKVAKNTENLGDHISNLISLRDLRDKRY